MFLLGVSANRRTALVTFRVVLDIRPAGYPAFFWYPVSGWIHKIEDIVSDDHYFFNVKIKENWKK